MNALRNYLNCIMNVMFILLPLYKKSRFTRSFTSAYRINPDIGIAIDVGFGSTPELSKAETLDMGRDQE